MNVLPVIVRELRAQSRQPFTYWLRLIAGGAVLTMFAVLVVRHRQMTSAQVTGASAFSDLGTILFGQLNATLFMCNCLLAPLLTADCISREKREGTLGLLFLTKLSAAGIVTGKSFVHALRGASLFVAMLPVLAIPILLGGIGAKDCAVALLIDSTVLVLGLAAGLVASAFAKDWARAFVLAELLSVSLVIGFMFSHGYLFSHQVGPATGAPWLGSFIEKLVDLFRFHTNLARESHTGMFVTGLGFRPVTQWNAVWSYLWTRLPASAQGDWFQLMSFYLTGSLVLLCIAILLAAWRVRRVWREQPASSRFADVQQAFTRPRFGVQWLRRQLARSLNRNPIGWLQQYSWSARTTKWGWCLAIVLLECLLVAGNPRYFEDKQYWVLLLLLSGLAFSAAGSFRRERETGALELLVVCPLTVHQIIGGRLRGVLKQFIPSGLVLLFCLGFGVGFRLTTANVLGLVAVGIASYLSVSVVGLYLSLFRVHFLAAWLLTMVIGVALPPLCGGMLSIYADPDAEKLVLGVVVVNSQLVIGALAWFLLYLRLQRREFALAAG